MNRWLLPTLFRADAHVEQHQEQQQQPANGALTAFKQSLIDMQQKIETESIKSHEVVFGLPTAFIAAVAVKSKYEASLLMKARFCGFRIDQLLSIYLEKTFVEQVCVIMMISLNY